MDSIDLHKGAKIRKTIHLIRHGQTEYNRMNIVQGSGIDSDLNDTGRQQALDFYKTYKDIPYNHIYTSQLKRAMQSVEHFVNMGIPHTALSEFNEINWGMMEGRRADESNTALYEQMIRNWSNGLLDTAVEGGETPSKMFERQKQGLDFIMSRADEEIVLICMHGRALRSFLCLLTGTPLKDMEKWEHHNLCLYELVHNGRNFDVTRINDVTHL